MTEHTNRSYWDADEQYAHQQELRQQRQAWEEQKKVEDEQAELARKRAALEAHLQNRTQEWVDTVGTSPSASVIQGWQQQYMDEQELVRQAEREAKLAAAEEQYD
jgi:hypothetical protein